MYKLHVNHATFKCHIHVIVIVSSSNGLPSIMYSGDYNSNDKSQIIIHFGYAVILYIRLQS